MDEAEQELRSIIEAFAGLPNGTRVLAVDDNLFDLGMSSYAMVNVMLALEETFHIELPTELFRRETFESIRSLQAAVWTLRPEELARPRPKSVA